MNFKHGGHQSTKIKLQELYIFFFQDAQKGKKILETMHIEENIEE